MTDPRAAESPEVLVALRAACASVRGAVDGELLELARLRIATLLGTDDEFAAPAWGDASPAKVAAVAEWPTAAVFDARDRAALALTEQFVLDVSGVATGPLGPAAAELGTDVAPFVQGLYLLDVGQRIAVVLGRLFGTSVTSTDWAWPTADAAADADPMQAIMELLASVGRLDQVDPVTRELVRLRGARLHHCRRCQSVRSVAAIDAGASDELLDAADPAAVAPLGVGPSAAVELVDATFVGPPSLDEELFGRLTQSYDATELVELVDYLLRNASNKIAVAFGADAALVDAGFEYQVIDADGATVTVDATAIRSSR